MITNFDIEINENTNIWSTTTDHLVIYPKLRSAVLDNVIASGNADKPSRLYLCDDICKKYADVRQVIQHNGTLLRNHFASIKLDIDATDPQIRHWVSDAELIKHIERICVILKPSWGHNGYNNDEIIYTFRTPGFINEPPPKIRCLCNWRTYDSYVNASAVWKRTIGDDFTVVTNHIVMSVTCGCKNDKYLCRCISLSNYDEYDVRVGKKKFTIPGSSRIRKYDCNSVITVDAKHKDKLISVLGSEIKFVCGINKVPLMTQHGLIAIPKRYTQCTKSGQHDIIVGICLSLWSCVNAPYVIVWITEYLLKNFWTHHEIVKVVTCVYDSMRKIKELE